MVNTTELEVLVSSALPKHVAIIMDGNGRWAEQRGKIRVKGHHEGVKAVRSSVKTALKMGIQSLTLFAFSRENWRRPEEEVNTLMKLFMTVLTREAKKLHKSGVCLKIIGDRSGFSTAIQEKIQEAEELTANNRALTLNVASNYSGQWDMSNAARQIAQKVVEGSIALDEIDDKLLTNFISMSDQPAVDLMIRTGGDHRISNFLLWQIAYAELYFTNVLWPDFNEAKFEDAVVDFVSRERRFGCTGAQIREILKSKT